MKQSLSNNPLSGDIVCVSRGLYKHYGIYINDNRIIHFAPKSGCEINQKDAYIQEVSLETFLKGGILKIDTSSPEEYSPEETVKRAESCLGTQKGEYSLVFHNCEHFARWCKSGVETSKQVRNVVTGIAVATVAVTAAVVVTKTIKSNSEKTDKEDDYN